MSVIQKHCKTLCTYRCFGTTYSNLLFCLL